MRSPHPHTQYPARAPLPPALPDPAALRATFPPTPAAPRRCCMDTTPLQPPSRASPHPTAPRTSPPPPLTPECPAPSQFMVPRALSRVNSDHTSPPADV